MSKFNIGLAGFYCSLTLYGEYLQYLASKSAQTPSWLTGHLTDISLVAQIVAMGQGLAVKNKILQYLSALAPPIACTLHELEVINLNSEASTYDPQDILCYWGGAALAFGLSKVVSNYSSREVNTIEDKL